MQCNANHACISYLSSAYQPRQRTAPCFTSQRRYYMMNASIEELPTSQTDQFMLLSRTTTVGLCNCLHLASDSLNCGSDVADSIHRWSFFITSYILSDKKAWVNIGGFWTRCFWHPC